jgi:lysozyme family protein
VDRIQQIIGSMIDTFEGRYSNHPSDRGGPTNMGVTLKVYDEYLGRPASVEELKLMPRAQAIAIFRSRYWNAGKLDLLPEALQPAVFDAGANMGIGTAAKMLQQALGDLGRPVPVDGVIGKQTSGVVARAVADFGAAKVVNAFCDRRHRHYAGIIADDPTQEVFRAGWFRRCDSFRLPAEEVKHAT